MEFLAEDAAKNSDRTEAAPAADASTAESAEALQKSVELKQRFAGEWAAESQEGFREMLVWLGVPWLLSFVIVRKTMKFSAHFEPAQAEVEGEGDPLAHLCIKTDTREEHMPTDGTEVDVTVEEPFERQVQCTCRFQDEHTMLLRRTDVQCNSMKKHASVANITRRLLDADTIQSTLRMEKLTDHTHKVATFVLKRQKPKRQR